MIVAIIQEFDHGVRVIERDEWAIVQQFKAGEWFDIRLFDRTSNGMALSNALEDAERLSARCFSTTQRSKP